MSDFTISNPPRYRYPLFDEWDKETFALIRSLAGDKKYPGILGSQEDRDRFLTTLIRAQKSLHGWRGMLIDTISQIKETGKIDTVMINGKYPPESIGSDIPAWVTYAEDRQVSDFIDELAAGKLSFAGTAEEMGEFVLRFILGQLGNDWELTILMIREILGKGSEIKLRDLNSEMKNFDYAHLFG